MKNTRLWIVLAVLAAAALACNAVTGIGQKPTSTPVDPISSEATDEVDSATEETPSDEPTEDTGSGNDSEFPLPSDVSNFMELGDGLITFQSSMSLEDLLKFYQDELSAEGYTEREILTVTSETTFSMVYDGHASGKAIVVQGVDLGGGMSNITIRLEAID